MSPSKAIVIVVGTVTLSLYVAFASLPPEARSAWRLIQTSQVFKRGKCVLARKGARTHKVSIRKSRHLVPMLVGMPRGAQ